MKNAKFLLIAVIALLIIVFAWLALSGDKSPKPEVLDDPISVEQDILRQEALIRWQANCEADGGVWLSEYEFCYDEETALMMRESCENFDGVWLENSRLYECEVNGEVFRGGEWEMIDWDRFEEMKTSCLDSGGDWIGGAGEGCSLGGDIFYSGMWMVLGEMEESCINEFGGTWLGGENTECRINGVVYPGNWVQVFAVKESCESSGGSWLGGDRNECQIAGDVYTFSSWERIEEMRESCESSGGVYVGGNRFRCDINNTVYYEKNWERMLKVPSFEEKCLADGGTWVAGSRACQGLSQEWCTSVLAEIDLGALGWNNSAKSCYVY